MGLSNNYVNNQLRVLSLLYPISYSLYSHFSKDAQIFEVLLAFNSKCLALSQAVIKRVVSIGYQQNSIIVLFLVFLFLAYSENLV